MLELLLLGKKVGEGFVEENGEERQIKQPPSKLLNGEQK